MAAQGICSTLVVLPMALQGTTGTASLPVAWEHHKHVRSAEMAGDAGYHDLQTGTYPIVWYPK